MTSDAWNRALFESVVHLLAPLLDELVFVGGCTTRLLITDLEDIIAVVDGRSEIG